MPPPTETSAGSPGRLKTTGVDVRRFPWIRPLAGDYAYNFTLVEGLYAGDPTDSFSGSGPIKVYVGDGQKPGNVGSVGDNAALKEFIKTNDWNDMEVIARGNTLIQLINGHVMSQLVDDDKAGRKMDGLIGIQLHQTTGPMKIETRNIRKIGRAHV